ncbi:phosphoesterase RecJ domain-containing protein [Natronococcus amylolyticus DSM 10524]|uniref:Phosphoesterase RecJ domain-containing protein n=1 Tax=Natronococcus amylolyticus DSM 10524 TaxID=1227497 RepID=L9XDY7_9EURY|nr:bifunctional oligoribonuclease/PAP phosphatase NrnA [Natronococcus amylolyticus]ELY59656.1 phosphoesterase RecJ domain-containing protein [Natronococcus amylolyticus DSM 10524]
MSDAAAVLTRLRSASSLTVVCHDDPDPDSLASAIALESLARARGVDTVDILYGGTIVHQQNRAFVELFDVTPQRYSDAKLEANDIVAFVDHSVPGDHNSVPPEETVDIVIDHHPTDGPIPADVVDVRESYGATATILAEYFRESATEPTPRIASALLFGIHRERLDFYRQPTDREYAVADYLHERSDPSRLRELYGVSFLPDSVDAFGDVIHNRVRWGSCLASCIGRLENRVALAQGADFLLNIDGVDTVLVCGIIREEIHLSGRTNRPDLDLGETLIELFDDRGNVGGHDDMAGGQLPLTPVAGTAEDEAVLVDQVRDRIGREFLEAVSSA